MTSDERFDKLDAWFAPYEPWFLGVCWVGMAIATAWTIYGIGPIIAYHFGFR